MISSDPSKMSSDRDTILSTTSIHPKNMDDLEAIKRYLDVLKIWDAESGR